MKKAALLGLLLMFGSSMASAETVKEAAKNTGDFWAKEGERSGLKDSTSNWGNFWNNVNPVNFFKNQQDAYNARKGNAGADMKAGAIAK